MPTETGVFVVDAHEEAELTDEEVTAINNAVERAEKNDEYFFYMLPEGKSLDTRVHEAQPSSILRYDPEREDPYRQARVDEHVSNREISRTQFVGKGSVEKFAEEEDKRGRPSFAGPPEHSNAPPWAGPPDNKGNNGNGKGGPPDNKGPK